MNTQDNGLSHLERMWDAGQRHLANGRYVAARRELEGAERLAFRTRDAGTLARVYLPLLEARRQIRQNAVEGTIIVADRATAARQVLDLLKFSGTLIATGAESVSQVQAMANRTGAFSEAIILVYQGKAARLVSPAAPRFVEGINIHITGDAKNVIDPDGVAAGTVPAPIAPAGIYRTGEPLQVLMRESLLIAWETLALRWQSRHPLKALGPSSDAAWQEVSWLRKSLEIDPACEPAAMRLMALTEAIERGIGK